MDARFTSIRKAVRDLVVSLPLHHPMPRQRVNRCQEYFLPNDLVSDCRSPPAPPSKVDANTWLLPSRSKKGLVSPDLFLHV